MKTTFSVLALILLTISSQNGYGQKLTDSGKRLYETARISDAGAPVIDGKEDDSAWDHVEWSGGFIEYKPDNNTPPGQETEFKITYDDKNLYAIVRCHDTAPDSIISRLSRRDGFVGDRINFMLGCYGDKRTAFIFTVTAAGVKGDEILTQDGQNVDDSWNPIWYADASIDEKGWVAELQVPFSQLRFGAADSQEWELMVVRKLLRTNEESNWQFVSLTSPGYVSEFGLLTGLDGIKQQKQLEIQPFVVGQYDTYEKEQGNPFRDGKDAMINVGLDAKIGVTNDLTLDLTVNPDFGQVDADPGAIALDGFQIFFEERRPFFVENKSIFDFGFSDGNDNVFYSRRIGRAPQGRAWPAEGGYVSTPLNSTILGAAKFSGKTRDGWSIGVLESVTANEYAEIESFGGRTKQIVEPLTNYFVGRLQKDFNNRNSFIGGILTSTNRRKTEELSFLSDNALTGGLDFNHLWNNRDYYVRGKFIGSLVKGSETAIRALQQSQTHRYDRVDAGHVEVDPTLTSLSGTGGNVEYGKANGAIRYKIGGFWRSPGLELNDIGFLRQADELRQYNQLELRTIKPGSFYREIKTTFKHFTTFDYDGNYNRFELTGENEISYTNNWTTTVGFGYKPRIFINTFLRGGPRWRFSDENFVFAFLGSDNTKKFSFVAGYIYSAAKQSNFKFRSTEIELNYQPLDALSMSLSLQYQDNPNRTQYVNTVDYGTEKRYILGKIENQSLNAALRINYSINPNMSIQYYGSPFYARGRFSDFNRVIDADQEDLDKRVSWYSDDQISLQDGVYSIDENRDGLTDYSYEDPNFSFVQFRSNLVARWEYIPGSELFLVWSQGGAGGTDIDQSIGTSIGNRLFEDRLDNTFLIKYTYRFRR